MPTFELILCIIAAVVLSSFLSRFIPKVSTPLVQIALGVLASQLPFFPDTELDPELFMVLFIAPLLYLEAHLCIIAAVVLSSFLSRFIPKVSTPLVQIALGVLASQLPFFPDTELDPELFMVLFIAPLLYLEAHEIDKGSLLKSLQWWAWGSRCTRHGRPCRSPPRLRSARHLGRPMRSR